MLLIFTFRNFLKDFLIDLFYGFKYSFLFKNNNLFAYS